MDVPQDNCETLQAFDVFISYAHDDAGHDVANARSIAEWLESLGYRVWWDRHLLTGELWLEALVQQATRARRVLMLWSPRSANRSWVWTEARIGAGHRKLVPLIIEKHPIPEEFAHVQFTTITDFEAQKPDILKALGMEPSGKRLPALAPENARISLAGLPSPASIFIGREAELSRLHKAWASTAPGADPSAKTNAFVLHAIGGAGKSALMRQFLDGLADKDFGGAAKVYAWSAYSQGSGDNRAASADEFIAKALAFFGHDLARHPIADAVERGRRLAALAGASRALLVLDGLEPLQDAPHVNGGRLKDRGLAALITTMAASNKGLLLITSRQELPELGASHGRGNPSPHGSGSSGVPAVMAFPLPEGEGQGEGLQRHGLGVPAQQNTHAPRIISLELDRMDAPSGVALLAAHGVHGKRTELERAVNEVLGHALSLNLLGAYLAAVHGGDINQREQFHLGDIEDAPTDLIGDATARYAKRAARIMEGSIARFEALEGRTAAGGEAETAILHMVGLFDRPAEREALDALLAEPAIPGLTDAFHGLTAAQRRARWNVAVDRLRKLKLLAGEDRRQPSALDAHPIVRAHFGDRLKARAPEAYTEAHSRLYDYYRYSGLPKEYCTPEAYAVLALMGAFPEASCREVLNAFVEGSLPNEVIELLPPNLAHGNKAAIAEAAALIGTAAFNGALAAFLPGSVEGMRPCFAAIAHGCASGRHQEAYSEVYFPRVFRGNEHFVASKLGALNAELAALAPFFGEAWGTPAVGLRETTKALLLNFAAFALRALGRLREAAEPFEARLKRDVAARDWKQAAIAASNVSELRLSLGDVAGAITAAKDSVKHADASGDAFRRIGNRTTLADALHQGGDAREALAVFAEAGAMQAERQPALPKLYSLQGYRYCDFLLAAGQPQVAIERASLTLSWMEADPYAPLLTLALDHLTLGRAHAALCPPSASGEHAAKAETDLGAAVDGLRRAGTEHNLPWGLLARTAHRRAQGDFPAAATDLAEAFEIATRGEMRLHLTDCHLETARLALAQLAAAAPQPAPRASLLGRVSGQASAQAAPAPSIAPAEAEAMRAAAEAHVQAAAALIEATGYKRRLGELAALRACLAGALPAHMLGPDRDGKGRPIWHDLITG